MCCSSALARSDVRATEHAIIYQRHERDRLVVGQQSDRGMGVLSVIRVAAFALLFGLIAQAHAQQNVQTIGPITPGDVAVYNSPTVIKDGGSGPLPIPTGNPNSVLITNGSSVPAWSTTLPSGLTIPGVNALSVTGAPSITGTFAGVSTALESQYLNVTAGSATNEEIGAVFRLTSSTGGSNPVTAFKVGLGAEIIIYSGSAEGAAFNSRALFNSGYSLGTTGGTGAEIDADNQTGTSVTTTQALAGYGPILTIAGAGNYAMGSGINISVGGSGGVQYGVVSNSGVLNTDFLSNSSAANFIADVGSHTNGWNAANMTCGSNFIIGPSDNFVVNCSGDITAGTWEGSVIAAAYLPTATTGAKGLMEVGSGLSVTSGTVSVTNPSPSSTTSGDLPTFSNSTGGLQDSGTLLSSLAPKASPTFTGTATSPAFAASGTGSASAPDYVLSECGTGCGFYAPASGELGWAVGGAAKIDYGITNASSLTFNAGAALILNSNALYGAANAFSLGGASNAYAAVYSNGYYAGSSKGVTCSGALTVISSITINDGIITAASGTGGTCS